MRGGISKHIREQTTDYCLFYSAFKLNDQEVSNTLGRIRLLQKTPTGPPLDVSRYVDAERYITILKPLPVTSAGRSFVLNQKCVGIYDKGKHTVHAFQTELVDVLSGEAYARFINTGIALGQGGWGGPRGLISAPRFGFTRLLH
jgi:peroxisomal enoyl-CoA hydratase 2